MGTVRWNIYDARRTRMENVRLFPAAQVKRPSAKKERADGENFALGPVLRLGRQINDAGFFYLQLVVGKMLAVGAVADEQVAF